MHEMRSTIGNKPPEILLYCADCIDYANHQWSR
jgi:hypothetical protein